MLMQRIDPRPFGDDEDANQAVRDPYVLEAIGKLSVESQRLVRTRFTRQAAFDRQRAQVRNLRGLIEARARSVHVDEAEFLEAARLELQRQIRKPVRIDALPSTDDMIDETERRLRDEHSAAILHEQSKLRRLNLARAAFTNAQAATEIARIALDQHRALRGQRS